MSALLGVDHAGDAKEREALGVSLAPGEKVVWTGSPRAGLRARQALPQALAGVLLACFASLWVVGVLRGGGKWDQGHAVRPFAPHNIVIGGLVAVWFLTPSVLLMAAPWWAGWKARRTRYVLTDRRAVVVEPTFGGKPRVDTYWPDDLRLMWVRESSRGAGDLVFGEEKDLFGYYERLGFLAVDDVQGLACEMRKILLAGAGGEVAARPVGERTFRLAGDVKGVFTFALIALGFVSAVSTLFVLGLLAAALWPGSGWPLASRTTFKVLAILSGLIGLACGAAALFYLVAKITVELFVDDDGEIEFRSYLRAFRLRIRDIISIQTGSMLDTGRSYVLLRHKSGRLRLVNQFPGMRDFLAIVKSLNPSAEIRGF